MNDHCRIALLKSLDTEIIDAPHLAAKRLHLPDLQVTIGYNARKKCRTANIHLLPNGALRLYAEETSQGWVAINVSFTAPSLIHGHNGRTINTDQELTAVLSRLAHHVLKVLPTSVISDVIPGLTDESKCYWSAIELAWHIPDPDGSLFRSFRNMRHPSIRKQSRDYNQETVSLPGKEVGFIMYRKDLQMAREIERFSDTDEQRDPVLRFELKLKSQSIVQHFGATFREINDAPRLVRFTLDDMKAVFRAFAMDLKGVWNTQGAQTFPALARFIAHVGAEYDVPLLDLCQTYSEMKGLGKPTASNLRKDALAAFAGIKGRDLSLLFSDEAFDNQPIVEIPRLESKLADVITLHAWDDPEIAKAYTKHFANGFRPLLHRR